MPDGAAVEVWGLSSQVFLVAYWLAALAIVGPAAVHLLRSWITYHHVDPDRLRPQEIGYLSSGAWGAVFVSLAWLRAHGVIDAARGALSTTGAGRLALTELDRAVHLAATYRVRTPDLLRDRRVARAVAAVRHRLEAARLVVRSVWRRRLFRGVVPLAAVGVVRLYAGFFRGYRDEGLFLSIMVVVAAAFGIGYALARPVTATGAHALAVLRRQDDPWAPAGGDQRWSPPGYADGPDAVSRRVALGGPPALRGIDPEFAEATGMTPRRYGYDPTAGGGGPMAGYHGSWSDPFLGTGGWGGGGAGGGGGGGGGGGDGGGGGGGGGGG